MGAVVEIWLSKFQLYIEASPLCNVAMKVTLPGGQLWNQCKRRHQWPNFKTISIKSENAYLNEIQIRFKKYFKYEDEIYKNILNVCLFVCLFACLLICLFVCLTSVIKMIWIINSISWVRCASGNVCKKCHFLIIFGEKNIFLKKYLQFYTSHKNFVKIGPKMSKNKAFTFKNV